MERAIKKSSLEKTPGGEQAAGSPGKTKWGRFKKLLASAEKAVSKRIAVVAISVALAVPCAVSCSLIVPPNDGKEKDTASDTGSANADTDTDTDVDTDTGSTNADTDSDTDTDTDTDVDTDADMDTDTDVDADTDVDLGFGIEDAQVTMGKETAYGFIIMSNLPMHFLYDPEGYGTELIIIQSWITDKPANIYIWDPEKNQSAFRNVKQGQTVSGTFTVSDEEVTKYVHLFKTYVADDNAEFAFIQQPIVLEEGEFVDLGNGISGNVSIKWENQFGQVPSDPQYIWKIKIGETEGVWGAETPITPGKGVPVCPGNEGRGLTGGTFIVCTWPNIIPAARIFIEFGGEQFAVTRVHPPGGVF